MDNGSVAVIQTLQTRVNELEQQLAEAQASLLALTAAAEKPASCRFELLHAHSRDSILFIRREDGRILDANDAALRAYGYSQSEMLALTIQALRSPNTDALTADQIARDDAEGLCFETLHRRKDGSIFPVEISSQGATMDDERILISVMRDITERKQAEAERARLMAELQREKTEAQQRAKELHAIIEAQHDPVLVYDRDGMIYRANASAVKAHGFDPSQKHRDTTNRTLLVKRPDGRIAHSADLPSARALRGETVIGEPLEITNAQGHQSIVLITSTPLIINGVQMGAVSVWHDISEQKRAENAMQLALASAKESQLLLEAILENVPIGLTITGGPPDFPLLRASRQGVEMNQRPAEELVSMPSGQHQIAWGIFLSDGVTQPTPEQMPLYRASRFGEQIRNQEMIMHAQDGRKFPVLVNATPVHDADGQIVAAINTWLDITEIKQVEAALRESEERYKNLFDSIDEGFCIIEVLFDENEKPVDYRFLAVNPAFERQTGIKNAVGRRVREIVPQHEAYWYEIYGKIALTGEALRFENRAEQLHHYYEVYAFRVGEPAKRNVAVLFNDISERKLTEKALSESEQRYRILFETMIEAFFVVEPVLDTDGNPLDYRFREANPSAERLFGKQRAEIIGRTSAEVLGQPDPEVTQMMARVALTGTPEHVERHSTQNDRWYASSLYPSQSRQVAIMTFDITERKLADEVRAQFAKQLERSNHELEQFAFVVSHDLQEPLRKIIRFGDSLAERLSLDTGDETIQYLRRMQNAAERMQAMIDGLLELSRISTQGNPFKSVALAHIAAEVISDLEARIQQERGQVQLGSLPNIEADPIQMHQLLQNLIANGLKFHQAGTPPVIRVRAEEQPAQPNQPASVVLMVEDNGIGFDEQDAARIFQPFQRLHARNEYDGTGMGLAICQKIVERHHGTITVHSRPGAGSTFRVELPLRQPA